MENIVRAKIQPAVKKVKKKQGKNDMDLIKQAEKKKRRLEKALATSAAIRLELEKKKQKKKEEQQRLDEEGAAIAEAVALNVLLGEDSEDSCKPILKKNNRYDHWDRSCKNVGPFAGGLNFDFPHHTDLNCSFEGADWVSCNAYGPQWDAGVYTFWPISSGDCGRSIRTTLLDDDGHDDIRWETEDAIYTAGVLSAQALSSLRIVEDSNLGTIIFNRM